MNISSHGLDFITREEGERLRAYHLQGEDYWTIGVGHYGPDVKAGMTITKARSRQLLRGDIAKAVKAVNGFLARHKLTQNQNQFDVLVSLAFNLGAGIFDDDGKVGGTLRAALKSKRPRAVAAAIPLYNKGGSPLHVLAGLVSRRRREVKLYLTSAAETMTTKQAQSALKRIGWPIKVDGKLGPKTRQAIKDFQMGYWGGFEDPRHDYKLVVDGRVGARTAAALRQSLAHGGKASPHFYFREFADKQTKWIKVHRDLIHGLEVLRKTEGPIVILSGYRDPSRKIGAAQSMHKVGGAMDPVTMFRRSAGRIAELGVFSGIGVDPSGRVRHLDVRGSEHMPNYSGGTKRSPTIFVDNF